MTAVDNLREAWWDLLFHVSATVILLLGFLSHWQDLHNQTFLALMAVIWIIDSPKFKRPRR